MIFKKWKNIIHMYFNTKSYLKSNRYHTAKHARSVLFNEKLIRFCWTVYTNKNKIKEMLRCVVQLVYFLEIIGSSFINCRVIKNLDDY